MKILTVLIILAVLIQSTVSAQSCLPEGITFSTQAEIDNFQTNYPNCTEIERDVKIDADAIRNLNGLSVLTSIGGRLQIRQDHPGNTGLSSLTGLENLTTVGGELEIWDNPHLKNLTGLDNLNAIDGNLSVHGNNGMTNLTGLDSLTSIGEMLMISGNDALKSLTGLGNIDTIQDLLITDNASLSSCEIQWLCDYLANPGG